MIARLERLPRSSEVYRLLRPYVASWFKKTYGSFTAPQRGTIPLVKRNVNVLVSSPTGTGKTLAAFLGLLDNLYTLAEEGRLEEQIYVVYVSPLRALNNDMRRNLLAPISGIEEEARRMGYELPEIRVAVRTSDTSPSEKQRMLRKPPHILITTPESLAISLVAPRFREKLSTVRWVVIDEIHELASSKRGSSLSLSLERLEELTGGITRIGMSATIAPLEEVAKFLVGYGEDGSPRPCVIIDARFTKPIDIRVLAPVKDLLHTPVEKVNDAIYRELARIVKKHRTTLIFTNTRSSTERVAFKLRRLLSSQGVADMDEIEAHHSSLSRDLRLEVEGRLKRGELKAIISSTSLELGIDIGYIDVVVLLSSPKSVSRLLQRVGRAGHHFRRVSKGRLVVVDRDDLVECTVLAKAALSRHIDKIWIPRKPLDVLMQHLVAMSLEKKWRVEDAYRVVRRAYPYRDLSFKEFLKVLRYLAGRYGGRLERHHVYSKIWFDEDEGVFGRKRSVRMIYYLNSGTIPDESKVKVFTDKGRYVGNLEEEFVQMLVPGDIFVLGGRVYEFIKADGMRAKVRSAEGRRPTVPSWFSEMLPLAYDSAIEVGGFRRMIADMIRNRVPREKVVSMLVKDYKVSRSAADNIYEYILSQYLFTDGRVPSDKLILVENYVEGDRRNLVFHTLFGRRVNGALARAYGYLLSQLASYPVRITVSDNGFMLTIPRSLGPINIEELVFSLTPLNIRQVLRKALRNTEMLKRIFRHVAQRSFMILRRYKGYERSPHKMQLSAQRLLRIVEEIDGFPVLEEAYREIMEDKLDVTHAEEVLRKLHEGEVKLAILDERGVPSPFAHHLVVQGYSDIVLMEDRRRLLEALHRRVMEYIERLSAARGEPSAQKVIDHV